MSEPLLNLLKLSLLVLLYLFFFRVLRAVWVEVKDPAAAVAPAGRRKRAARDRRPAIRRTPPHLVVVEPDDQKGQTYDLDEEVTLGRAAGCRITVDDNYVSQIHARVFHRDGQIMVEDLGSTNGSYLNRQVIAGLMVMQRGDQLQVGNTILELK